MSKTIEQILNEGGDDRRFLSAAQMVGIGSMLAWKTQTLSDDHAVFKCSEQNLEPMQPGAIAKCGSVSTFLATGKGTFAETVPTGGLTFGVGNSAIRIFPKPGIILRYAQFNPGGPGSTAPSYVNASSALKVVASKSGNVVEVWVSLANSATAVVTSTPVLIQAALLADPVAMQGISSIDFAGGTGLTAAVSSPNAQLTSFRPSLGALIAASATDPAELSPGTFVLSQDGNLCFLFYSYNRGITFDYRAAPKLPLAMEYPGV
jgi:hypothetical protein